MINFVKIWYDILFDMIWFDLIWFDLIWYNLIWYNLIWFDLIWFGIIWYDMIWCNMILRYVTKFELMTILFLCYGYDVFDMIVLIPSSSWLFEDNHYHFEQYVYLWLDLTWRRRISDHIVSYRILPLLFCSVLLCSALLCSALLCYIS